MTAVFGADLLNPKSVPIKKIQKKQERQHS
jgi:hypothetical protein